MLVIAHRTGSAAGRLSRLGAAVSTVSPDRAIPVMKRGLRAADAIVIEDAPGRVFDNGPVRLANLARAIQSLPSYICMPTGARWNSIPIVLLVDGPEIAGLMERSLGLIACATSSGMYWDYIDPWPSIYERIDAAAYDNAMQRLEEMQSIGHRFQFKDGRWLRMLPPKLRRKGGFRTELETALYNGTADILLRRARLAEDDWSARDVVLLERGVNERDLYLYEHLVKHATSEREMQQFYTQRAYMLGAGTHDIQAHPMLLPDGSNRIFPDLLERSFNDATTPKPARIIELKRPDAKIIVKNGLDYQFSHDASKGIMQTHRYGDFLQDDRYAAQVEATFGEAPLAVEKLLVIGRANRHDRTRLDYVRRWEPSVKVRGYDEMYEEALERFAS